MSDLSPSQRFEHAFHRSAERHERVWIFISVTMLVLLLLGTLFYAVFDYGLVTKPVSYNSNPTQPAQLANFKSGAVIQTGPNAYSVYMTAHLWAWSPGVVHLKQGAVITFYVTSIDVLHGFEVQNTAINLTAIPGVVGTVTYTFATAGTYHIICNEYCGVEHQSMVGEIIVDPSVAS